MPGTPGTVAPTTAFDAVDGRPVPIAFVAATVKVYVDPMVGPVTVPDVGGGEPLTTTAGSVVEPPGPDVLGTIEYDVIGLPPSAVGAAHETEAVVLPAVAVTLVGAPGGASDVGTTALEDAEAGPTPTELVALTWNV